MPRSNETIRAFSPSIATSSKVAASSVVTEHAVGESGPSGSGRDFSTETIREQDIDLTPEAEPTIHALCQAGNVPELEKRWAEGRCDVNERDESDVTPLHWASINAQVACCQWLLDHGADIDAIGGELRATPLQWAARNGHLYIMHLLLQHGADPNIRDSQGFNTLHLVTHSSVVMALLYILHQPIAVDEKDTDGHTALMWAAWQGDAISVDLLLKNGASVHATDNAQLTPLHWAAVKGSRACINKLLDAGADVLAAEENGKTPWMMAEELKALEPFKKSLEDAEIDQTGRSIRRFSKKTSNAIVLVGPTIFLFLIFSAVGSFPPYTSIPLAIGLFFAMHHVLTRMVLGSPGSGDKVTNSPYYVAIISGSLFWVGFCWIAQLASGASRHFFMQSLFALCLTACCYNFYRAIVSDPGHTPPIHDDQDLKAIIEDLASKGSLNGTVFCVSCMNRKPLRAKHCRLCNRCTARFDHHCPWIWNCVGFNNHPSFLLFVGTLVVGIIAFDILVADYTAIHLPLADAPKPSAYPTVCSVFPTFCGAFSAFPFLLSVASWATLQLTWTSILLVTQSVQVFRQMTTLEVSNLGRYGFMGGRGGSSLRDQSGAVANIMARQKASQQLSTIGAGANATGAIEAGEIEEDGVSKTSVRIAGQGEHAHPHHHRCGAAGRICGAILNACTSGPMLQLLGLDRFTKGKAIAGLRKSGGSNPFDLGAIDVGLCAPSALKPSG